MGQTSNANDHLNLIQAAYAPPPKATFNRSVDEALQECTDISNQRGGEYADSWATENQSTHFLDSTLALIDKVEGLTVIPSKEARRLIMLASLCDVKVSRMAGGWKRDTYIDLINYVAAYTTLSQEYQGATQAW